MFDIKAYRLRIQAYRFGIEVYYIFGIEANILIIQADILVIQAYILGIEADMFWTEAFMQTSGIYTSAHPSTSGAGARSTGGRIVSEGFKGGPRTDVHERDVDDGLRDAEKVAGSSGRVAQIQQRIFHRRCVLQGKIK